MPHPTSIECPLCGSSAQLSLAGSPTGAARRGVHAIACSGSCISFIISDELIGKVPLAAAEALSQQAAAEFQLDPDAVLEITPWLLQTMATD